MAGRGPAPKPQAQRRNHHPPARGEWVELGPLERPAIDDLPEGDWRPSTRALWAAWRADPVTAQWSPADVAFALDTIGLYDAAKNNAAGASELRLRMDGLGLTPKGKRDLRWRIVAAVEADVTPIVLGSSARRLRAVDPVA